ncbi:hypothetical protein C8F04DRAFT_1099386 [Mycena alexandri]|uniref:Uncharacterized protein n=1 Tax=Mycena alexandri TaxID=1745969 RepID=A0AAD6SY47_9AGAR|nr:hypothetical protein C8F04DRAFT_1099386 [Mycena alexandri]
MSSAATFCDAVVSTQFDSHATSSHVSLDWVLNSGVPTCSSRLSGRLTLPCNTGEISILLSDVAVVATLPCDLVLGLDCVQLMCKSAQRVVVHLSSSPLDFRTPGSSIVFPPLTPQFQVSPVRFSVLSVPMPTGGPRTRDGISDQDVQTGSPVAPRTRGKTLNMNVDLMLNEHDPFGRLASEDKIAVTHFLIVKHQIDVLALRRMTARHNGLSSRLSGETRKSTDVLHSEFITHQCTEACPVLKSEALLAGLSPPSLTGVEIQLCILLLGTQKRHTPFPSAAGNLSTSSLNLQKKGHTWVNSSDRSTV